LKYRSVSPVKKWYAQKHNSRRCTTDKFHSQSTFLAAIGWQDANGSGHDGTWENVGHLTVLVKVGIKYLHANRIDLL